MELIKDIKYLDPTSKLHDHKPVLLNFKLANQNNKTYIDPTLLDIPGLQQTVTLATLHTFTDYISTKNIYPQFITDMQINLLAAQTSYATIRNLIELSNTYPYDKLIKQLITNKCTELNNTIAQYKTDYIYKHTNLTITDNRFMEVLFNKIQLEIISHQRYYKKHKHITQGT